MELTRPSRRELIASFLGLSVAAAACRQREGRARVPGRVVDRAVHVGHRLREGGLPTASGPARPVEVVVVGAGVAGLSAAWRLSAAGVKDVLVLELEEAAGGTARGGGGAAGGFPWGAHYLPAPVRDGGPVMRLLRELGAVEGVDGEGRPHFAEHMLIREPEERLFYRGSWYPGLYLRAGASAEDVAQLQRFEARMAAFSAARDGRGRKAFAVPVAASSDDAEWTALDRLSMAAWMRQEGFTSERLRGWVDYACRDDFGCGPEETSAWAGVWYFAARHEGEAVRSEGYLSWPEGNARLVAQLSRALSPAQLLRNTLVHTLVPHEGGCQVHALRADTGEPVAFEARHVIYCGPRFTVPHVLAPWRREAPAFVRAFSYAPWVVANLTVSERPQGRGFPPAWDNVLYESRSLGYVTNTHQLERQVEAGPCVLTWYYPFAAEAPQAARARMLGADYAAWEELVMADLRVPHPELLRTARGLEVMRWGHAMVRPTPGFLWGGARAAAAEPVGCVHFAHADLGGMSLFEEANHFGVRAAEAVLARRGHAGGSWL